MGSIVIFKNILRGGKIQDTKSLKIIIFFPKSKSSHETKCTAQGLSLERHTTERAVTH